MDGYKKTVLTCSVCGKKYEELILGGWDDDSLPDDAKICSDCYNEEE